MFGVGYQEMFIVLVVALVIFGPKRLPELAGQVGRWVRDFRRMSADLTGEFEKTFAEVDEVKKSFKREMQSIQDEVEGVGKSARGDLKKSGAKGAAGGKKTAGALKAGSGSATSTGGAKSTTRTAAKADSSTRAAGNGARPKMPTLATTKRAGALHSGNGAEANGGLPAATKEDPLVDVSFLDLELTRVVSGNGAAPAGDSVTEPVADDALSRVRRRRATATYGRHTSA
ncbi:MAG: Sec-independent protein translocase protein TatB [Thermomicrobiales bacterium]